MAHQFKPVDRDSEMLLPYNRHDWVREGHAVRVVISAVEQVMTRDLAGRLVPPPPKGPAAGPARYDPVMLLTVWMYACLRGALSTRAVQDRCRHDATFRLACGRLIPAHVTFSRFRQHLLGQEGLAKGLFCRVFPAGPCAGPGRRSGVAAHRGRVARGGGGGWGGRGWGGRRRRGGSRPRWGAGRPAGRPGSGMPAAGPASPAAAPQSARPAPAWRNCRPQPPPKRHGKPPGTGRTRRGPSATSPIRTPG